jgi:hypothetical protein
MWSVLLRDPWLRSVFERRQIVRSITGGVQTRTQRVVDVATGAVKVQAPTECKSSDAWSSEGEARLLQCYCYRLSYRHSYRLAYRDRLKHRHRDRSWHTDRDGPRYGDWDRLRDQYRDRPRDIY